jgi:hypothetical protein
LIYNTIDGKLLFQDDNQILVEKDYDLIKTSIDVTPSIEGLILESIIIYSILYPDSFLSMAS